MSSDDFSERTKRIAARLGFPIRDISAVYIVGLIKRDDDPATLADEAIADRLANILPGARQHFDLAFVPPKSAVKKLGEGLDHGNKIADAIRPKTPPQKTELTEKEKAFIGKHPNQKLDLANLKAKVRKEGGHE